MTELITFAELNQLLSDNFETLALMASVLGVIILAFVVFFTLRKIIYGIDFKKVMPNIFWMSFIGMEIFLATLLGVIYWNNYQSQSNIYDLTEEILRDRFWAKKSGTIYFINDNTLLSMNQDGEAMTNLFKSNEPIREYHFSPDGRWMLVVTYDQLYLVERSSSQSRLIDTLQSENNKGEAGNNRVESPLKGAISSILWSPDSRKFCYKIARWSPYAQQDNLIIYDLVSQIKRPVQAVGRKIASVFWDKKGESLYYLYFEAKDTQRHAYPYEVDVYHIPLDMMKPELVARIPAQSSSIPWQNLEVRGIQLYSPSDALSFSKMEDRREWKSQQGWWLGIDQDDCLFFVKNKWFRKRLFKLARLPLESINNDRHKKGDLALYEMRWIPGQPYVMIGYSSLGILILDPFKGKIGRLTRLPGRAFGWFNENTALNISQ